MGGDESRWKKTRLKGDERRQVEEEVGSSEQGFKSSSKPLMVGSHHVGTE